MAIQGLPPGDFRIAGFSWVSKRRSVGGTGRVRFCRGCLGRGGQKLTEEWDCVESSGRPVLCGSIEAFNEKCAECGQVLDVPPAKGGAPKMDAADVESTRRLSGFN